MYIPYENIIQCASIWKYANTYVTYELTGINNVTQSTVHKMLVTVMQDDNDTAQLHILH